MGSSKGLLPLGMCYPCPGTGVTHVPGLNRWAKRRSVHPEPVEGAHVAAFEPVGTLRLAHPTTSRYALCTFFNGGFTSSRLAGAMARCSRAWLRMIAVDVSVRMQNFVTTASRCDTSMTAISRIQLSSPVTL